MTSDFNIFNQYTIERVDASSAESPQKWFGPSKGCGFVYVIKYKGEKIWSVGIDFGDASHVPFREEFVWISTKTVVIGGGNVVYFLDMTSGDLRKKIEVPSFFGHLELIFEPTPSGPTEESVLILGWTDVHAIDKYFNHRWVARNVAIDGIIFCEALGNELIFSAEMDPPGGWVEVALDAQTGRELWRQSS